MPKKKITKLNVDPEKFIETQARLQAKGREIAIDPGAVYPEREEAITTGRKFSDEPSTYLSSMDHPHYSQHEFIYVASHVAPKRKRQSLKKAKTDKVALAKEYYDRIAQGFEHSIYFAAGSDEAVIGALELLRHPGVFIEELRPLRLANEANQLGVPYVMRWGNFTRRRFMLSPRARGERSRNDSRRS